MQKTIAAAKHSGFKTYSYKAKKGSTFADPFQIFRFKKFTTSSNAALMYPEVYHHIRAQGAM